MRTRLIVSIDRKHAAAEVAEIIDMAIRYRSRGVVGVDLCGDPSRPINLIMLQREFARAKAAGLGVTLHFAEIAASSSLVELEGLLAMRPDRLGHVIHVDGEVKEEIAARKTGLELCLSCNVNAKLTSGGIGGHHFRDWWSRKERGAIGLCVS